MYQLYLSIIFPMSETPGALGSMGQVGFEERDGAYN